MPPDASEKPSIAEREGILDDPDVPNSTLKPDGSVPLGLRANPYDYAGQIQEGVSVLNAAIDAARLSASPKIRVPDMPHNPDEVKARIKAVCEEIEQALKRELAKAPVPTIGRNVHYQLSDSDVAAVKERRRDFTRHKFQQGSRANPGDIQPAIVVWVFDTGSVNLQVFLDGNDSLWVTGVEQGDRPGTWHWPPRV